MIAFKELNRLVAAAVTLLSLYVYFSTVAPTVTFWDTGEFIAAAYLLGVPHPPGAPFHTLLGRFFSMLPIPGEVAYRVNLISVFAAAATVLLVYLCVVRLLSIWLDSKRLADRIAILTGGAVAALSVAFSTSFWANATEAEVYALSMGFTLLAFYLALRWDGAPEDARRDRLLIFIAFLFGLGAGVHLQCLLTVPGILILVFIDLLRGRPLNTQFLVVAGLVLYPFLAILLPVEFMVLMTLAILIALVALRPAWRNPWFWIFGLAVAGLGYSTYIALIVRSGLNPLVDMNNPANWANFKAFLAREQYGTHSIFPRRGDFWDYQFNIHVKYFLQQFPFYDLFADTFRRAVTSFGANREIVVYSVVPLLFGLGGALYHMVRDWKRFSAVFAMFALMGIGLVLYLNMPDPEPREREYIFVGAYTFFGFWIGMGAAGLIVLADRLAPASSLPAALVALLTLTLPAGLLDLNYFSHDRSRDYIAHDYGYNILNSCAQDAILFTNGDNDTYPLWFLQYVKGIRRDVRVVNLSLLKTTWYAKQLRDLEPKLPIYMTNEQIERDVLARPWPNPRDMTIAGLQIKADEIPIVEYPVGNRRVPVLETHTFMIWYILQQNNWERPVYFAVTVPEGNMGGLRPYLSMEGMCYRLTKDRALGQFDINITARHLFHTYRYTGIADRTVYKDAVARRLLSNYLVIFEGLVRAYLQQGLPGLALHTLRQAEMHVPPHALEASGTWDALANHYRQVALKYVESNRIDSALISLEELIRVNPEVEDRAEIEATINTWKAAVDSPE